MFLLSKNTHKKNHQILIFLNAPFTKTSPVNKPNMSETKRPFNHKEKPITKIPPF